MAIIPRAHAPGAWVLLSSTRDGVVVVRRGRPPLQWWGLLVDMEIGCACSSIRPWFERGIVDPFPQSGLMCAGASIGGRPGKPFQLR